MPEFRRVLLPAATVNNFARNLASALRKKGWAPREIKEIDVDKASRFVYSDTALKEEAYKATRFQGLPAFLLYEQALPIVTGQKAEEPVLDPSPTTAAAELVHYKF